MTNRILTVLLFAVAVSGMAVGEEEVTGVEKIAKPLVLQEGYLFDGVDGVVFRNDDDPNWYFSSESDASDDKVVIKAGTAFELLFSSTLEKLTDYAEKRAKAGLEAGVKLIGRTTKYEGKNYIFPVDFIPLSKVEEPVEEPAEEEGQTEKEAVEEDPDDASIIPQFVRKRLEVKRVVSFEELKETEDDFVLVDRSGFLVLDNGGKVLAIDSLGRKVDDLSFKVLRCTALEETEETVAESANRVRFRIAGVVTKYEGEYYILLQRAVRTYSHGNFVR